MSLLLALTAVGGATYTLTAAGGTYTYSGGTATLVRGRTLVANGTTYSYTGGTVNLVRVRTLTASGATYTYSGGTANFLRGRTLTASGVTYSYAGGTANLLRGRILTAAGGVYSYAGGAANLTYTPFSGATYTLTALGGVFSYSGGAVNFRKESSVTGGWPIYYGRHKKRIVERETFSQAYDLPEVNQAVSELEQQILARREQRRAERRDAYVTAQLKAIYAEQDALIAGIHELKQEIEDDDDLALILSLVS